VRDHQKQQFVEGEAPLFGPALADLAVVEGDILVEYFDLRGAREFSGIHQRQDVHGGGELADAGQGEAVAAVQADVLAGSQVQGRRSYDAVGFGGNLAPAAGRGEARSE
jgi:hypothetical protein